MRPFFSKVLLDLTYPLITSRYKVIDRKVPSVIKRPIEKIIQVVVDVKYGFRTIDPDYILTLSQNDITSNDESMSISFKEHGILLDFYKENITFKVKEVNYEKFVKEVYK